MLICFCSAYVIRLFGRCSRFLDPALDTSTLNWDIISFTVNFHYYDHCLSWIVISNINLLLLDVIVQSSMADYFWSPTSLYLFSFQCWWLWETTNRLKSINNKCFMYITHNCKSTWRHLQQEDKGKLCIVIHAKINYIPIYQNQPVCWRKC